MMCPVSFASIPGQPDRPKPCLDAIVPMRVLRLQAGLSREAGPRAARSSRAGALGSSLPDPCLVSNDPKVARPRLKAIHRQGDGVLGRSGRPAVTHTVDLAASLELVHPGERLAFIQARGSRDHRGRERARHLAQCRSQAIPIRPGLALLSLRRRRRDIGGVGGSRFGCRAYVLPADPHRSELGSCRTRPPAHVRAGGPPQTDAIRARSDRRRSGHARSISIKSSPFLALHGHIGRRSGTDGGLRVTAAVSAAAGGGRSRCARRTARRTAKAKLSASTLRLASPRERPAENEELPD
jgi:hypothetical protein